MTVPPPPHVILQDEPGRNVYIWVMSILLPSGNQTIEHMVLWVIYVLLICYMLLSLSMLIDVILAQPVLIKYSQLVEVPKYWRL